MFKSNHHNHLPPIASITGIDGSGKSTVARLAHLGLSERNNDFSGVEVDRQIHLIEGGEATRLTHASYDDIAGRIDGGNKLAQGLNRIRYARSKAHLGHAAHLLAERDLDLFVNVRDPILDSYIFAGEKLPASPAALSLNLIKQVSGARWPDATIWLDVDPDEALARIAAAYTQREEYGAQEHENPVTLGRMRDNYKRAIEAMRRTSNGQIVRVDASRPTADVVADVQNVLSDLASSSKRR